MSRFVAQAVATLRKVNNGEPLDECDVAIIGNSLTRTIGDGRTPFQRTRSHFIIGTERFGILDGFDYYRTILLKRKSGVWYPDSNMSELSIFEVYTGSQLEPPDHYSYRMEDGSPDEHAEELLDRGHIGPCFSGTYQEALDPKAISSLRNFVAELSQIDSTTAVEKRQELEQYLRSQTPGSRFIRDCDLNGTLDAFLKNHHFQGKRRSLYNPKQKVADLVRHATNYAREVLRKNPMTADIADHLEEYVRIGQICEYQGDWKWHF